MSLTIGDDIPDVKVNTTHGEMNLREYFKGSWGMLFSHPRDFTPVCTTELSEMAKRQDEFDKRGMKLMAISCDTVESHNEWIKDLESYGKVKINFPIIGDENRTLATQLKMLDPEEKDNANLPVTVRACFVFGPDGKVKLTLTYPPSVGRSAQELLRVVDALQLGSKHPVATPVNWKQGDDVMILPSVSEDDAKSKFPSMKSHELPSGKKYVRTTPQPN
eukprot:gb/GECG01016664.1/.p1 GENE.gb/GECG01016664.1/~~gb/GECG01016664.1/.p1  ORF type:complete len:219 (+),score=30.95 gb/GECG01016664.1/:1-657(+)